ncbi:uncharacterized protein BT62DRAFT_270397 [Guyanagaster necrorhizus]|uniref:Uncharacterized protein n=1 Tax=Guyanagaster necrorhizus TaxID=856835 RepID=A0A9P8AXS0_9AGAR|nr:uncharacterized protein BT62DRAFT_270397 [Guyanagaster necrorhizus MCA 3950]KAG7451893.1 hypothetical protein BT62DRAFT_270397 [Guyanagaster necrorhizus MCA 3950]
MMPRSILKRQSTASDAGSGTRSLRLAPYWPRSRRPRVHFPPTSVISSTHLTHSRRAYNRKPIVVSPNLCELPGRDERVYTCTSPPPKFGVVSSSSKRRCLRPAAYKACEPESELPSLTLGISELSLSESPAPEEESNGSGPDSPDIPPITMHAPVPRCPRKFNQILSFFAREKSDPDSGVLPRDKTPAQNPRNTTQSAFREPEPDGCLGGF